MKEMPGNEGNEGKSIANGWEFPSNRQKTNLSLRIKVSVSPEVKRELLWRSGGMMGTGLFIMKSGKQ